MTEPTNRIPARGFTDTSTRDQRNLNGVELATANIHIGPGLVPHLSDTSTGSVAVSLGTSALFVRDPAVADRMVTAFVEVARRLRVANDDATEHDPTAVPARSGDVCIITDEADGLTRVTVGRVVRVNATGRVLSVHLLDSPRAEIDLTGRAPASILVAPAAPFDLLRLGNSAASSAGRAYADPIEAMNELARFAPVPVEFHAAEVATSAWRSA